MKNLNIISWVFEVLVNRVTGLFILGFYCFGVSIWGSDFAKLRIPLPFLKFPIFIGEMVMLLCMGICGWFIYTKKIVLIGLQRFFAAYLGCVVLWTAVECISPGGSLLALRNAVLFFYPIFAFFTYFFYDPAFFSRKSVQISLAILLWLSNIISHFGFHNFICSILFFIVLYKGAPLSKRNILIVAALFLWSYRNIFSGERTWLVASVLTGLFLIFVFVTYFLKWEKPWKLLTVFMAGVLFLLVSFHFADKVGLKTLIRIPKQMIQDYPKYNSLIQQKEILCHSEKSSCFDPFVQWLKKHSGGRDIYLYKIQEKLGVVVPQVKVVQQVTQEQQQPGVELVPKLHQVKVVQKPQPLVQRVVEEQETTYRHEDTAYDNVYFRLFIWRDMLVELWEGKKIFGVGLAHPQRSHSIEILGWGFGEWSSVGWITPHNSFLGLIYRAGIIGIGLIVVIFVILYRLVRDFIDKRSVVGVLLCGIIIYGLISANFFLILELPYYAIPFWSIFGVTMAYRHNLLADKNE